MRKIFSTEHRRRAVEVFDNARRAGKTAKEAAAACGHAAETVAGWRDQMTKPAARQRDTGLPAMWDYEP
ncbi:MAG: hypothetical protein AB7I68_05180 [Porticoccaceae bacterium]